MSAASESSSKVLAPGKKCGSTKPVKGASQRSATYTPDYSSGDPDVFVMTGDRPGVGVTAMKLRKTKDAVKYLHGYAAYAKKCPPSGPGGGGGGGGGGVSCTTHMKRIRLSLGDEP